MTVRLRREGALAHLRLAAPDRRNALTPELCSELAAALERAAEDTRARCVLLDAEGEAFCVGADLGGAVVDPAAYLPALVRQYHRCVRAILTMPKPVVVAVGGVAAGGGLSLALSGDVRIASDRARFRLAYPGVAVSLDGAASWRLPRLAGTAATEDLVWCDPILSAHEAHRLGLVHEVTEHDAVERHAGERAARLAAGPTAAFAEIKRLLNPPEEIQAVLAREEQAMARTAASNDARAAIEAFLAGRRPVFEGR